MNPDDIKRLFPNASRSVLAANLDHPEFPGIRASKQKEADDAVCPELEPSNRVGILPKGKAKKADTRRFLVRVTSIRSRLIDEDNLCEKFVVDCCRYAGLLPGDGPGQTKIEVSQRKVGKEEPESTLVEIFELNPL